MTVVGCTNAKPDCLHADLPYYEWCEVCTPVILAGRKAKCAYYPSGGKYGRCPEPVESSRGLAFFEYEGPLSDRATKHCTCGMRDITHGDVCELNPYTQRPNATTHPFSPRGPSEFDRYFCGCWGWD